MLKGEEAYAELWCVAAKEGKKKSAEMDGQILEDLQKYLWLAEPGSEIAIVEFLKATAKQGAKDAKKPKVGGAASSTCATASASSSSATAKNKASGKVAAMRYFS